MSDFLPQPADVLPLLPGGIAAALLLIVAATLRLRGARLAVGAIAPVLAVFVTWLLEHGAPPLPPAQSTERVLWSGFGWAGLGGLLALRRNGIVALPMALVAAALVAWIVAPLLGRTDAAGLSVTWCAAVGASAALGLLGVGRPPGASPGFLAPATTAIALGAAGQVFVMFGSALLAQLAGTLSIACALTAAAHLSWVRRQPPAVAGVATATGLGFALAADGYAFLDATPPGASLALLALVPLTPLLVRLPPLAARSAAGRGAVVLVAAGILTAAALAIALAQVPPPDPMADLYK